MGKQWKYWQTFGGGAPKSLQMVTAAIKLKYAYSLDRGEALFRCARPSGVPRGPATSTLRHSAFFTVQLSHPYMTTGKTIALTRQTFVGKVMSLLFNMLSRLVIIFLPRSKRHLISWLQSPSAVILEPQKTKSDTVSTVSPSISHEVMGPDAMILVFWMLSFKPTFSLLFHFNQEAL